MLGELSDGEALGEQGSDDLAEAVVPRVAARVRELHRGLDVGARLVPLQRLGGLEVGEADDDGIGYPLVDRPHRRVALAQEEPTTRGEQGGDDLGPAMDVRQPAERTDAGVDEVEGMAGQHVRGCIELGLDELDSSAGGRGEPARLGHRRGGEVQAGHRRAQPRQRQGVGADVALQMHPALAGEVTQARLVESHHVATERGIGDEAVERIARGGRVRRGPLVPERPVHRVAVRVACAGPGRGVVGSHSRRVSSSVSRAVPSGPGSTL